MLLNGIHAVTESLQQGAKGTLYITIQNKSYAKIVALAKRNNCNVVEQNPEEIKERGGRQGVAFRTTALKQTRVASLKQWLAQNQQKRLSVLILDHILDPQNFGAIVRTATLLGIDLLLLPERRMAPENAISTRSASGGMSILPRCYESNLPQAIAQLQKNNFWIYALDMQGVSISSIQFTPRTALILGGEHKGLSRLVLEKCDEKISIPNNASLDSFNVSVSAAIACYELYTQQNKI